MADAARDYETLFGKGEKAAAAKGPAASPGFAGASAAPWFAGVAGTADSSDFLRAFMSALPSVTFSDRSAGG